MSEKFDENVNQNKELKSLLQTFKTENDKLKKRVVELEDRCSELEQSKLNKSITLSGIPNQGENENVGDITKKVLRAINVRINDNDIKESYRRGKQGNQIVVKFHTEQLRNDILKKRKEIKSVKVSECNLTGENNTIYFNELLTNHMSKLFYNARGLREKDFKYVWVKNGRIFARKNEKSKTIQIKNEEDINNIEI